MTTPPPSWKLGDTYANVRTMGPGNRMDFGDPVQCSAGSGLELKVDGWMTRRKEVGRARPASLVIIHVGGRWLTGSKDEGNKTLLSIE